MIINVFDKVIHKFKLGQQTMLITEEENLNKNDKILLEGESGEQLEAEVTAKYKFNSFEECLKIIPIDLFGRYKSVFGLERDYKKLKSINIYRLKVEVDKKMIIRNNKELRNLIYTNDIEKNNVGLSSSEVFQVKLKSGENAILKIQTLSSRNNLHDEYERIRWLQGKAPVPKIYYYGEINKTKYLLMEKKEGKSAHKTENFGKLIGKSLKEFHDIDISSCNFIQNRTDILLEKAISNIDIIFEQLKQENNSLSKEEIISFLKKNVPEDQVLVHGDYSLPNILIDDNKNISLIDLGDVSISTKYFDLFYLRKSLIRNKKIEEFDNIIRAYGEIKINENYMRWIELVDKVLY